ncbi:DUF502 domain-containing protein [Pseudopedobacter beijingensis]|uniref:DUF502 domain-containing protein n=1 Tax=Pseudopedobacter beijingensis TaxID=1207056 RepID=A0ABW4IH83_9SPHI
MKKIFNAFITYCLKGVLLILPIGGALFLLLWGFSTLDSFLNFSESFLLDPETGKPLYIPGLGILSIIIVVFVAGIIATFLITEPIYAWINRQINKVPILRFLYSSVKDITEAFVGDEKKLNEPVIVEMVSGIKKIGFLTQKDLRAIGLKDEVAVYFPWSYSFAGELVIVKADRVKPLNVSSAQAMKFIVSGGVTSIHN